MNIYLTIALIGASVSVVGWVITHILATSAERRRQRLISQMKFTKQQLEELYGPLAFLTWEGLQLSREMKTTLNLREVLQDGKVLSQEGFNTWLFWVENEFLPHDRKILELISSKAHLVEGETIPESFLEFVNYHNAWRVKHERWRKQGIEYEWRPNFHWPKKFDEEVLTTFKLLKKRHAILIGLIAEKEHLLLPRWFHRREKSLDRIKEDLK